MLDKFMNQYGFELASWIVPKLYLKNGPEALVPYTPRQQRGTTMNGQNFDGWSAVGGVKVLTTYLPGKCVSSI